MLCPLKWVVAAGVDGDERLLPFGVAAVGTVGVGVEQLADGETVGGLGR